MNAAKCINKYSYDEYMLDLLPNYALDKILGYFQTSKVITLNYNDNDEVLDYQMIIQLINTRRKLVLGSGINTDIKSIYSILFTNKKLYNYIKNSDSGKLLLSIYYHSDIIPTNRIEHISFCKNNYCSDVCHYIIKDIKYTNLLKRIQCRNKIKRKINEKDSKFSKSSKLDTI